MIKVKNLVKKAGDKVILRNLNLSINAGETVAILGPNGAGKSTLLKVLATLMKPTSGKIEIANYSLKKEVDKIRNIIGYLPHSSLLYEYFSPYENLEFYGNLYGVKDIDKKVKDLIKQVELTNFLHEPVKVFSRGMIQRVAIARAMIHDPNLLLLDEPHTGLDQKAINILNDVILSNKKTGVTTLMVTHDLKQAAKICDRAIIIKNGKVTHDFLIENYSEADLLEIYSQFIEEGIS